MPLAKLALCIFVYVFWLLSQMNMHWKIFLLVEFKYVRGEEMEFCVVY